MKITAHPIGAAHINFGFVIVIKHKHSCMFKVAVDYDFRGQRKRDSQTFYIADFKRSVIFREPIPKALYKMEERLSRLSDSVGDLVREARKLEAIADGSGLRLSQRTIAAIQGGDQLFDPSEFGFLGYKVILDVTTDEALSLNGIFQTMIPAHEAEREYNDLPEELREKFERRFRVAFRD